MNIQVRELVIGSIGVGILGRTCKMTGRARQRLTGDRGLVTEVSNIKRRGLDDIVEVGDHTRIRMAQVGGMAQTRRT